MRQKTIKAIQNMRPQNIRARPAASSPRGAERSVISCRNPPQSRKIILCWRRRIMRRLRNGERSPVLFTAILMPPPSRANWIKRNATRPFSHGILSAGQKAISVPSTRVVSCRSSSDHSCWATTIAGARDELLANPRHRAARLPRRLSVVGKGVSGQFLSGLLV